jgi:hypothetical protein
MDSAKHQHAGSPQPITRPLWSERLTPVKFHISDGLPFVHGDKPVVIALAPTTQVNDQLAFVAVQSLENPVEPLLAEFTVREEKGGQNDLLDTRPMA